jgi:hypothetical protein
MEWWNMKRFQRGSALSGQPVDQIVSIVDLKGIEFGKHLTKPVYEFIKKLSGNTIT